ncbi:uncharacterized MFS-type transporter C09D4.1-like isoform X1 [Diabrotica virgifera virgifera]|uniref:Uncharacterized MFS-type transporter C09D4.1-like isoform X1 n=1 Tax=Diabrotica virgifera virgifera TaxID=50390 RepID=A0A6P7F5P2_DIAVI|nr:uncharacterized MFS-type transporter C09D4.1-like isoform X1 [Diabrotica virgifera virgifera]
MLKNGCVREHTKLRSEKPDIRVYWTRWMILFIYNMCACLSTFQWIQYSIITNVVLKYYHVSESEVDWSAMSFSAMWPLTFFPVCYIIDKTGLRVAALIGAVLTLLGAAVKIFSIGENLFWVVMIGQTIVAVSQIFILTLPSKLAVTWFKPQEVSTACSLGLFGLTFGSALGFVIPPMIVRDSDNLAEIGNNFKIMCWALTLAMAPVTLAIFFYFPAEPPYPPSQAMLEERQNRQTVTFLSFMKSIKSLLQSKSFLLHNLCYACNVGIYCSIGTLLNQLILSYFPGEQEEAGRMGLVMILTGMVGSILTGIVLDKTHKYKETAFIIFVLTALSLGGLTLALEMKSKWMVYLGIGVFGFFLNGYLPAGIEFAIEMTFPSQESTVTGILLTTSQVVAVILTIVLGIVLEKFGALICIITMIAVIGTGCLLTLFTPNKLNRQKAFMKDRNVSFTPLKQ